MSVPPPLVGNCARGCWGAWVADKCKGILPLYIGLLYVRSESAILWKEWLELPTYVCTMEDLI